MDSSRRDVPTKRSLWLLRWGLGLLFLLAGLSKVFAIDLAARVMADHHLPFPTMLAVVVGAAEIFAGALLLTAVRTRSVSRILAGAVTIIAVVVHDPIGLPPGVAHTTAIAFTMDALVVIGLGILAFYDDDE